MISRASRTVTSFKERVTRPPTFLPVTILRSPCSARNFISASMSICRRSREILLERPGGGVGFSRVGASGEGVRALGAWAIAGGLAGAPGTASPRTCCDGPRGAWGGAAPAAGLGATSGGTASCGTLAREGPSLLAQEVSRSRPVISPAILTATLEEIVLCVFIAQDDPILQDGFDPNSMNGLQRLEKEGLSRGRVFDHGHVSL